MISAHFDLRIGKKGVIFDDAFLRISSVFIFQGADGVEHGEHHHADVGENRGPHNYE